MGVKEAAAAAPSWHGTAQSCTQGSSNLPLPVLAPTPVCPLSTCDRQHVTAADGCRRGVSRTRSNSLERSLGRALGDGYYGHMAAVHKETKLALKSGRPALW